MKRKFIALILIFAFVNGNDDEDVEMEWNFEAGVPHFPHPRYDENGEILFFPRIIGGSPAFLGEFPAKISLQSRRGEHFCGGALIDLRHILSAAHCVTEVNGRVIHPNDFRLMGNDLSIENRPAPTRQIRYVSHIFVHPSYDVDTLANDITVLRASVPFTQTPTLRPMPRALTTPVMNDICHLAGWGVIHEIRVRPHPILLRVELDVISLAFCNGTQSYDGLVPENAFCAGTMDGSRDACFGDSGGGLICNNLIAGIVSFGFGCGRRNFPGVYADVSRYSLWIAQCIASNIPHEDIPRPSVRPSSVAQLIPLHKQILIIITLTIMKFSNKFYAT